MNARTVITLARFRKATVQGAAPIDTWAARQIEKGPPVQFQNDASRTS